MPYLLFLKKHQNFNCGLLQIMCGALWVKGLIMVFMIPSLYLHIKIFSVAKLLSTISMIKVTHSPGIFADLSLGMSTASD